VRLNEPVARLAVGLVAQAQREFALLSLLKLRKAHYRDAVCLFAVYVEGRAVLVRLVATGRFVVKIKEPGIKLSCSAAHVSAIASVDIVILFVVKLARFHDSGRPSM
jgi:hypothetical protein